MVDFVVLVWTVTCGLRLLVGCVGVYGHDAVFLRVLVWVGSVGLPIGLVV